MELYIVPMERRHAEEIITWRYEGEYALYSFSGSEEDLTELLGGEYYAVFVEKDILMGYFCFGSTARIQTIESGVYDDSALDIGLGMEPSHCGKGGGADFVLTGLKFAADAFGVHTVRLTVANFNKRAIRAYEKAGFRPLRTVSHKQSGAAFLIMTLELQSGTAV